MKKFIINVTPKNSECEISQEKRTKLWLSSPYLIIESMLNEGPEKTYKIIQKLITFNEDKERYEECQELLNIQEKYLKNVRN